MKMVNTAVPILYCCDHYGDINQKHQAIKCQGTKVIAFFNLCQMVRMTTITEINRNSTHNLDLDSCRHWVEFQVCHWYAVCLVWWGVLTLAHYSGEWDTGITHHYCNWLNCGYTYKYCSPPAANLKRTSDGLKKNPSILNKSVSGRSICLCSTS